MHTATRRGRLGRRLAIAAAVVTVAAPPSALADTDRSYDTSGHCTIAGAFIKTDPDNVRPYLPEAFPPDVDPAGNATLQIEFFECAPFVVDGRDGPTRIGSTVTVGVVPHPGVETDNTEGVWGYDLWSADSRSDHHAAASRLGYNVPLVKQSTFDLTRLGAVDRVTATVPYDYSPYAFELTAGTPPPTSIEHTGYHYHLGPHGLVEITYPLEILSASTGVATVTAAPGSPLAEILGAESRTSAGLLLTLDFIGEHRLVEFPG